MPKNPNSLDTEVDNLEIFTRLGLGPARYLS